MGLAPFVCCNCFEKGLLRVPAPPGAIVRANGSITYREGASAGEQRAHIDWYVAQPCGHLQMQVISMTLATYTDLYRARELLAKVLEKPQTAFPILWSRVLFDGRHTNDHLTVDEVRALQEELRSAWTESIREEATKKGTAPEFVRKVDWIFGEVRKVIEVALQVGKPIVFR